VKVKSFVRTISAELWAFLLLFYIAAKVHFFTRYEPLGVGNYIREHSIFVAGMAGAAFLIWLLTRRLHK
jgi:hypothetical protein